MPCAIPVRRILREDLGQLRPDRILGRCPCLFHKAEHACGEVVARDSRCCACAGWITARTDETVSVGKTTVFIVVLPDHPNAARLHIEPKIRFDGIALTFSVDEALMERLPDSRAETEAASMPAASWGEFHPAVPHSASSMGNAKPSPAADGLVFANLDVCAKLALST